MGLNPDVFAPDLTLIQGLTDELTLGLLNIPAGELDSKGLSAESDHAPYVVAKLRRMAVKEVRESLEYPAGYPAADLDTLDWEDRQSQQAS